MPTPPLTFHKVDAMPQVPVDDGIYFVKNGELVKMVVVSSDGEPFSASAPVQMVFSCQDKPPANKEFGRYRVGQPIDLDALLSGAVADVAATADTIVPVTRGIELVARYTWPAAGAVAVLEILVPSVADGDVLIFHTPATQDATLAGIAGVLIGRHAVGG